MCSKITLFYIPIIAVFSLLTFGCDKDILTLPVGKGNFIQVSSSEITSITANSAQCNFIVNDINNETVTEQGICWGIISKPTAANKKVKVALGTGTFPATLTNLSPKQSYYVRPFISLNSGLTLYGDEKKFTTGSATTPKIVSSTILSKTFSSVSIRTSVSDEGATIISKGVCYSTTSGPTISNSKTTDGSGSELFNTNISNLKPNVRYYVRAYATNELGTSYGIEQSFILNLNVSGPASKDGSGNIYNSVQIGDQTWISKNLVTTKYMNGDDIPNITNQNEWVATKNGAYCDFINSSVFANDYGHLYNFYSTTDPRKLCPTGFHIPSKNEVQILIDFLGGPSNAAIMLKEGGTNYWEKGFGNNLSGFSGRAGSWRGGDGIFYYWPRIGGAWFWTSSIDDPNYPYVFFLNSETTAGLTKDPYFAIPAGTSIRCLKD